MVVLDEAPQFGNLANTVAATIQHEAFWYLDAPIELVTGVHSPIGFSPNLIDALLPSTAELMSRVSTMLESRAS
jgi:pyruvate dehydrogenase E1 component beta subunit